MLHSALAAIEWQNKQKAASNAKEKVSQANARIEVRIAPTPTVLSRSIPQRLLLISKSQKGARRKDIFYVKYWSCSRNKCLFWGWRVKCKIIKLTLTVLYLALPNLSVQWLFRRTTQNLDVNFNAFIWHPSRLLNSSKLFDMIKITWVCDDNVHAAEHKMISKLPSSWWQNNPKYINASCPANRVYFYI